MNGTCPGAFSLVSAGVWHCAFTLKGAAPQPDGPKHLKAAPDEPGGQKRKIAMKKLILALAAAASLAAVSSALPASAEVRYAPHVFAMRYDHYHHHHHWFYDRFHHRHWR
jgi:hypothetical protein